MLSSTTGSVSPRSSPITGLRNDGRKPANGLEPRPEIARAEQPRIPVDRAPAKHQRRVAQRLGAAGEDEIGLALADVLVGGVDRLHAGAAVDLHRERGHRLAHAETQRRDARRVHLVGDDVDAAENHLVEGVGRKRLAQQQRPPAGDREIDRRERTRPAARPDERRAAAVDDVDRTRPLTPRRVGRDIACDSTSPDAGRLLRGLSGDLARRQLLGREIIDRDRGGDCLRGRVQAAPLRRSVISPARAPWSISRTRALRMRSRSACVATVSSNARSSRASPSSPVPWKMSAVMRSRVADGSSRKLAQACVNRSDGPRRRGPSGSSRKRSSHAAGRLGKLAQYLVEARLDGGEAGFHAPFDQRQIGFLAALVLPALEHCRQQIELRKNVAEARRDHLLALERAAEAQQGNVGRERKGGRIASERLVETPDLSRRRRRRKGAAGPGPSPGAKRIGDAVPDMAPERAVERLEPARGVTVLQRRHLACSR